MKVKLHGQTINVEDGQEITLYKYRFSKDDGITITEEKFKVKIYEDDDEPSFSSGKWTCGIGSLELGRGELSAYYFINNDKSKELFVKYIGSKLTKILNQVNKDREEKEKYYNIQYGIYNDLFQKLKLETTKLENRLTGRNIEELLDFANKVCDKLCGDHAVIDTGSIFDVMYVVLEAIEKLNKKDLKKIQKTVMGSYWLS